MKIANIWRVLMVMLAMALLSGCGSGSAYREFVIEGVSDAEVVAAIGRAAESEEWPKERGIGTAGVAVNERSREAAIRHGSPVDSLWVLVTASPYATGQGGKGGASRSVLLVESSAVGFGHPAIGGGFGHVKAIIENQTRRRVEVRSLSQDVSELQGHFEKLRGMCRRNDRLDRDSGWVIHKDGVQRRFEYVRETSDGAR